MTSIAETAELLSELHQERIAFSAEWCTHTRHRRSSCNACMDACPHEALFWEGKQLAIDPDACTECGACAAACPTQALWMREPSFGQLIARINAVQTKMLTFSCEQVQKAHDVDDTSVIVLPCLAALDEFAFVYAAHRGIKRVLLANANCAQCPNAAVDERIERTCCAARRIFEAWGMRTQLQRLDVPNADEDEFAGGIARRNLLHELAEEAKGTAFAAATGIYKKRVQDKAPTTLNTLLKDGDGLKTRTVPRNSLVLDCLFEQETQPCGRWDTNRFATVQVDVSRCKHCGLCAFMCPTGALEFIGERAKPLRMGMPQKTGDIGHLGFRVSDCANCNLCEDACPSGAIHAHPGVEAECLFDLEPMAFE